MNRFDYLDGIAKQVAGGRLAAFRPLSTGERLYVALAANRADLLSTDGYTIVQAWNRVDEDWARELMSRWAHRIP